MSHITIQNDEEFDVDNNSINQAVQTTINRHDVSPQSTVTVVITTNAVVQQLNKQYRSVDAPTDVLSFPADPLPEALRVDNPSHLGDLIIAYPYASQQASQLGHDVNDSLCLLVVHGTLHLLGYDHDTPERRTEMWAEQSIILVQLAIDTRIVPALEGADHG